MVQLTLATWKQRDLLYRWRQQNEEEATWYEGVSVSKAEHDRWLKRRLESPAVQIWVARHDNMPVGVVRCDSNGELSYSVDPSFRGRGLGTEMVKEAMRLAPHSRLKACVDEGNQGGARVLLAAGWEYRPDVEFYLWRR